ncbi:MAG: hypothetical protein IJU23_00015 [Proteobacteria bacterium]|nr:hypothetical protein [Pseudomonadota bacterium]
MDYGKTQDMRSSLMVNTIMYFVFYVVGGILILFSLLNDEIFGALDVVPPSGGVLGMLDVLAFGGGITMWCLSEFKISKKIVSQYKQQWIKPIFEKNWHLTAYETDPNRLALAMRFALCSDAFLQKVAHVEMNDYAVGYYQGYKCFFMDLQPVKKDNSNFKGQIFGIQLEKVKFDKRITLRPSSIHNKHAFDKLPIMGNLDFASKFSFFDPLSGYDLGPSRKHASAIEKFHGDVPYHGWTKIQLMDKTEISAAGFFTNDIARFLLQSSYGYTGISIYKDMVFLFFSENAASSEDIFEFHKGDIFKSEDVMNQRIHKEFGGCMNMLMDFIEVLNISVRKAEETPIEQVTNPAPNAQATAVPA